MNRETTQAIASFGISANEFSDIITSVMRELPPLGETEIQSIKRNPSLSRFEKRRLIKMIERGE